MTDAKEFIGLSKFSGQFLAESKNMLFHLISVEGEPFFSYPDVKRDDRICVEIKNSKIVKAVLQ
jgi:hypothetical protein